MQRNAPKWKRFSYSVLSLSLLGSVAHAQLIEVEPSAGDLPDVSQSSLTQAEVSQGSQSLQTQPVALSEGMVPTAVPSPSLSGGTNSTGNSNGQGTQINLNIQNDQKAKQAMENDASRLAELQIEKRVREKINNERLMEKIEEDRITGEKVRTTGIERFDLSSPASETIPVASVSAAEAGAGSYAGANGAGAFAGSGATAIAVAGDTGSSSGLLGTGTQFKLSPVVGWRWYQMYATVYRPVNYFTGGLSLEGVLSRWMSLDGSFIYGRDRYRTNGAFAGSPYYGGAGAYGPAAYSGGYGYAGYIMPQSRDTFEVALGTKLGYQFSSVRPFVAVGGGLLLQRYNIDNQYTVSQLKVAGLQRATNYFIGNFGAGADFSVAKNLSIGGRFDYQAIFNGVDKYLPMNQIWGDVANRFRLTASAEIVF